jgi:hypothetical protein
MIKAEAEKSTELILTAKPNSTVFSFPCDINHYNCKCQIWYGVDKKTCLLISFQTLFLYVKNFEDGNGRGF